MPVAIIITLEVVKIRIRRTRSEKVVHFKRLSVKIFHNHNVYILGAGFSVPAGFPVLRNFFQEMLVSRDHLRGTAFEEKGIPAIEKVLTYRAKASGAAYRVQFDLDNIEELFSFLALSRPNENRYVRRAIAATLFDFHRRHDSGSESIVIDLKSELESIGVAPRVEQRFNYARPRLLTQYGYILGTLLGLFSAKTENVPTNAFLTFNYDLLLERGLKELGWTPDLSLVGGTSMPSDEDENDLSLDLEIEDAEEFAAEKKCRVLKLHGSIDWALTKSGSNSLEALGSAEAVFAEGRKWPFIIPPTWQKRIATQMEAVWNHAVQELNRATRIVLIGFSMPQTDQFFKYLLAAGLRDNPSLRKIVIVNPQIDELRRKAEGIFSPVVMSRLVEFQGLGLEDFVRWPISERGMAGRKGGAILGACESIGRTLDLVGQKRLVPTAVVN